MEESKSCVNNFFLNNVLANNGEVWSSTWFIFYKVTLLLHRESRDNKVRGHRPKKKAGEVLKDRDIS